MADITPERLARLRELAEAATPGPWGWRGHTGDCVELRTLHSGGLRVVSAMRGEPCIVESHDGDQVLTSVACDSCRAKWEEVGRTGNDDLWEGYHCPKPENLGTVWLWDGRGFVRPANHWAVKQVPYRNDVAAVDQPDARYIAAVSPEVVQSLLDERDILRAALADLLTFVTSELDSEPGPWREYFVGEAAQYIASELEAEQRTGAPA